MSETVGFLGPLVFVPNLVFPRWLFLEKRMFLLTYPGQAANFLPVPCRYTSWNDCHWYDRVDNRKFHERKEDSACEN
ncbi:MAG: hypothetical protein JWN45_2466 [Acidobacteriaceae bacterium]|nr:hypothetical protein [Acidobacteriaceae bacterium]